MTTALLEAAILVRPFVNRLGSCPITKGTSLADEVEKERLVYYYYLDYYICMCLA